MKKLYVLALLFFATMSANAQLKVNSNGRVSIGTTTSDSKPALYVETSGSSAYDTNIGVAAQTVTQQGKRNIAIEGYFSPNQSHTTDSNFGVLGFANLNHNHGRNFGISGMLCFDNSYTYQGGAGVYGADYGYLFSYPTNIQGIYAGYFVGSTFLYGRTTALEIYTPADDRLSENVESIGESNRDGGQTLDNLLKMNVLEFNMKNSQEVKAPDSKEMTEEVRQAYEYMKKDEEELFSRRHFGLSAQELQEIYPNLVLKGQDGYLCINYQELVPILIRSIQELNEKVAALEGSDNVEKQLSRGVASSVTDAASVSGNILYQNTPNPFKEKTVIRFRLADDAQNAAICIFDLTGKQLKKLPISSGETSISVNGWELGEGMFLYTLLVNGQEIDTKRMIITK
jgi:hypothetical protein